MKIDVLSDIHADFYSIPQRQRKESRLKALHNIFDDLLDASFDVPVLIVAGDLGHYNNEALEVLEDLAEMYNYERVFAVLGNHDLYKSKRQTSAWRLQNYMEYNDPNGIIHLLFGDIVEYGGLKFGGSPGWYYSKDYLKGWSDEGRLRLWRNRSNDAHYIDGLTNPDDRFFTEYDSLKRVVDKCDVLITHVCPTTDHMITGRTHDIEDTNAFYCFDGSYLLADTKLKVIVFGHSHDSFDGVLSDGNRYVTNTLGYPEENAYPMQIEI